MTLPYTDYLEYVVILSQLSIAVYSNKVHLQDDEIPVKGHGLIALTRLVKEKDPETEKNIDNVIEIFQVRTY
jgi:hypothetical protein